jgi:hypothetical protein
VDEINWAFAIILLVLGIAAAVVLWREFQSGTQKFRIIKKSNSMSYSGCYYSAETDTLELAPGYGGTRHQMTVLNEVSVRERSKGGVYLVYRRPDNDDGKLTISVKPITMELARNIVDLNYVGSSADLLHVYTSNQKYAYELAEGNNITPTLQEGKDKILSYYLQKSDAEDGNVSRIYFGEFNGNSS